MTRELVDPVRQAVRTEQMRRENERVAACFDAHQQASSGHPCVPGCCACCHGPFDVGPLELLSLLRSVRELESNARSELLPRIASAAADQRAQLGITSTEDPTIEGTGEAAFDTMCDALVEQPCPLLDDRGRCAVYGARPELCRVTGATWRGGGEEIVAECPIDLTQHFAAISFDVAEHQATAAAIEGDVRLSAGWGSRTTIAMGLDVLLRG